MAEKILIVDDDVDSLKLIGLMLKRNGYEVVAADSGGKALEKAESETPDLIILDVMMPDMSGLEVCRRLRANPDTSAIPIIMFTAKTLIDDKVKGFEAGADDYLTKPTHPAELASRVKAIMVRKQSKQETPPEPAPTVKGLAPKSLNQPNSRGLALGVLGAKGGVGTTSVAVNVAVALLDTHETPVISEIRPGMGGVGLMLNLSSQGLANILNQPTISPQTVENQFSVHQSGLRTLLASTTPHEAEIPITPDQAVHLVQALRVLGNPAIIDMGSGLSSVTRAVASEVDKLLYIVESTPLALGLAVSQLKELEAEIGGGKISVVVLNRSQSSLPWHEVENTLGREVKALIAPAPELAYQALVNHTPMVALQPNHVVSGQFIKLAEDLKTRIRSIANH